LGVEIQHFPLTLLVVLTTLTLPCERDRKSLRDLLLVNNSKNLGQNLNPIQRYDQARREEGVFPGPATFGGRAVAQNTENGVPDGFFSAPDPAGGAYDAPPNP